MNKVILSGRVTADIPLYANKNCVDVVKFDLAVHRSYKNTNGEYETDFIKCVAFSQTAVSLSTYVKKGDLIEIEGGLKTNKFYNEITKKNEYSTEVLISKVGFLATNKQ